MNKFWKVESDEIEEKDAWKKMLGIGNKGYINEPCVSNIYVLYVMISFPLV